MRITICFSPGFSAEAIVLAARGHTLRVAVKCWDDAAEFRWIDGQWLAENGDPVHIRAHAAAPGAAPSLFGPAAESARVHSRTLPAGSWS